MPDDAKKEIRGFAGLSSLVTDVGNINRLANIPPVDNVSELATTKPKESNQTRHSNSDAYTESEDNVFIPTQSSGSSKGKWVFGLIVLGAILLGVYFEDNKNKPSYSSLPSSKSSIKQNKTRTKAQLSNNQNYSVLKFEKPQMGEKQVLYTPQIRWCLREEIRIEAIRNLVKAKSMVEEFNRKVENYNNRCSSFRYRKGTLARAKREVQLYRDQIVSNAIKDAGKLGRKYPVNSQLLGSKKHNNAALKIPNPQVVMKVQQLLTTLGYDPGPIDGKYGRRTAEAITTFQKDSDIFEDGLINKQLLDLLSKNATYQK